MTDEPRGIRSIWDNGGRSYDRFTIVLEQPPRGRFHEALGLSHEPAHPLGFSQFGDVAEGAHLGRRIKWSDLPEGVRTHAAERLSDD